MLNKNTKDLLSHLLTHPHICADSPSNDVLQSAEEAFWANCQGSYDDPTGNALVPCDPTPLISNGSCNKHVQCSLVFFLILPCLTFDWHPLFPCGDSLTSAKLLGPHERDRLLLACFDGNIFARLRFSAFERLDTVCFIQQV